MTQDVLAEALREFFEDIDADWSNDNIRPGDFAFRFRHAADRLRAALVRTPETLDADVQLDYLDLIAERLVRSGTPDAGQPQRRLEDLRARRAVSPAPDPGAGLREALERIEQDAGWLHDHVPDYSPDGVATLRDIARTIAAMAYQLRVAPSAEPPETT